MLTNLFLFLPHEPTSRKFGYLVRWFNARVVGRVTVKVIPDLNTGSTVVLFTSVIPGLSRGNTILYS